MSRSGPKPELTKDVEVEVEKLSEQVDHLEQEARMVLPGVQALFGFQLVAAFEPPFWTRFTHLERLIHWFALGLVALATLLILLPAAYHRQVESDRVSRDFLKLANRSLYWGMYPIMLTICLDFYIIGRAITGSPWISAPFSILLFAGFTWAWFVFPGFRQRRKIRLEQTPSSLPKAS